MQEYRKKMAFLFLIGLSPLLFFACAKKEPVSSPAPLGDKNQIEVPKESAQNDEPKNQKIDPAPEEEAPLEVPSSKETPEKYLLDMPFYSQAPLSNWDALHEDMCEEASILNAAYYLLAKKTSIEEYEKELQKMQDIEIKEIGEWRSTTVSQTKKWADIYFEGKIKSKIIVSPTIEQIETEIAQNNPVIVPLAGRDIGNPNFTPPGPLYHMLVVKGYDTKNFITNDVGTRKGNSYIYKKEMIMKNMHDWNEQDIHLGRRKVLVLYKS